MAATGRREGEGVVIPIGEKGTKTGTKTAAHTAIQTGGKRREPDSRERRARILGVATALAAMAIATWWVRWPAPGVSVALGFGVYVLARGRLG